VAGQDGNPGAKNAGGSNTSRNSGKVEDSSSSGKAARTHKGREKMYDKAKLSGPYVSITFDDGTLP